MNELLYRLKNAWMALKGELNSHTVTALLDQCETYQQTIKQMERHPRRVLPENNL